MESNYKTKVLGTKEGGLVEVTQSDKPPIKEFKDKTVFQVINNKGEVIREIEGNALDLDEKGRCWAVLSSDYTGTEDEWETARKTVAFIPTTYIVQKRIV